MQENQVEFFKQESWNYFQRNYHDKNVREAPMGPYLARLLEVFPISIEAGSILDIGCAAGNNLFRLKELLRANRGVGVEPSSLVIEADSKVFPELEFYQSDCSSLPFRSGEFDLVVLVGVLCWVDREYLLQSLGEAIRVTSKYFILGDFAPRSPYSTIYHHQPDYRTYKINLRPIVEAMGSMRFIGSIYTDQKDEWNIMETVLFEKKDLATAFPLKSRQSFDNSATE